jgi:glucokinase
MKRVLLADIGGTHARFAVLSGEELGPIQSLDVQAHGSLDDAVEHFLAAHGGRPSVSEAILAVAGPVAGGRCRLTNSGWSVDSGELRRRFGFVAVRLCNDFEAAAWGLGLMKPPDSVLVGPDAPSGGAPMALLGPGTGLGMACYLPGSSGPRVVVSEGGHATLPATSEREATLIGVLRRQFGHVSAERVLSGPGLVNLYQAIATIDGVEVVSRTAAEVTRVALDGTCVTSRKALDTFCAFLGSVAGNAALLFGARGGVFIGGGIVPQITGHLALTEFRERFEAKGRFQGYLAKIAVRIITRPNPTFLGLAALAQDETAPRPASPAGD